VAELTPPLLAITFVTPAPPEAAPQPKPPAAAHHTQRKLSSVTQPPTTPQPTPTSEPPAWSGSDEPGPPDGPPDGPAVGRPGGGGPPCSGAGCIAAPAPRPRNLPPHALDAQRIAGAMPHLPPSVLGSHRGLGDATFTARLCVDTSGAISSVTVLGGIPGADGDIVSTLRGWRYKPQPIPVCFITQLVYDVQ
jgi:hypothetical protein